MDNIGSQSQPLRRSTRAKAKSKRQLELEIDEAEKAEKPSTSRPSRARGKKQSGNDLPSIQEEGSQGSESAIGTNSKKRKPIERSPSPEPANDIKRRRKEPNRSISPISDDEGVYEHENHRRDKSPIAMVKVTRHPDSSTSVWIEKSIVTGTNVVEVTINMASPDVKIRSWPKSEATDRPGQGHPNPPEQPAPTPPKTGLHIYVPHHPNSSLTTSGFIDETSGYGSSSNQSNSNSSSGPIITEADITDMTEVDEIITTGNGSQVESYYERFEPKKYCYIQ